MTKGEAMSSDPKNSLGRRPSPALVVALLALFVALSGTAYVDLAAGAVVAQRSSP
jgi:hypothetical protein